MHARRVTIDLPYIDTKTFDHKERIEHYRHWLAKIDADENKKERLAACECVICFKSSRIGGCAMTDRQCGLCDTIIHCGNTAVDVLCIECARATGLCKHCGADLNLKNKRKRFIPERTETIEL